MSRSGTNPKKMKKNNPTENRSATHPTEMNRIQATMEDLPELPFEKVLSYLSLEDRLKARAVSRRWYHLINIFKVKTLCYSDRSAGFIEAKARWVSGAYAQNFIRSTRFSSFFNTFGPTILSNLKRLRVCDLHFTANDASSFFPIPNMFGQLEELDIIRFTYPGAAAGLGRDVKLNLPMLARIRLEEVEGIDQLTLDSPKLKRVKLLECPPSLRLELVHADSVEWLATDNLAQVEMKNLKSLKYLHCDDLGETDATFLSGLEQLKEILLHDNDRVSELFEHKQRYGRTDLKIFLFGWLLNGPEDPAIDSLGDLEEFIVHLAKNPTRLADDIPLCNCLPYTVPEGVAPESAINFLNRFTDLITIAVKSSISVQDVQRFLDLLKNVPNIVKLIFEDDQPQDLFDRLPEHSAIQHLIIDRPVSDFRFLFRLVHLITLEYRHQINAEVVRAAFEELHFLSSLAFKHLNKQVNIVKYSSNNWVSIGGEQTTVADLNAVIQFVFERT